MVCLCLFNLGLFIDNLVVISIKKTIYCWQLWRCTTIKRHQALQFGSREGFSGSADRMALVEGKPIPWFPFYWRYFWFDEIQYVCRRKMREDEEYLNWSQSKVFLVSHKISELGPKNVISVMAALICILVKTLKGARVASTKFMISSLEWYRLRTAKKLCMDSKSTDYLRCGDLSLETFKRQLKTFLFAHY